MVYREGLTEALFLPMAARVLYPDLGALLPLKNPDEGDFAEALVRKKRNIGR